MIGNEAVTGAVLFDRKERGDTLVNVSARAVILATGGSGQIAPAGIP